MSVAMNRRDEIWAVWQKLVKAFGFRRMVAHLSSSQSGLGFYSVDLISSLRRTPMALAAQEVLQSLDDGRLEVLQDMARINAERNNALWRMAALFYVTAPTSMVLLSFQLAPELARTVVKEGGLGLAVMFVLLTVWMVGYYSIYWRAVQIQAVVELERAQRGLEVTGH